MVSIRFVVEYMYWHFGIGFQELYTFWKNLIWFGYHFFSIPLLLKTLIRPLYRIHESAPPGTGLNIELFFQNLTVNLIARTVGFFLRIFLIIVGGLYQLIICIAGLLLLVIWFLMPILPITFVLIGIQMLL